MKKIIALIMALVMVMGLAVTASAAGIAIDPNVPEGADASGVYFKAVKFFDAEVTTAGTVYYVNNNGNDFENAVIDNLSRVSNSGEYYFNSTLSADGTKYYVSLTEAGEALRNDPKGGEKLANHLFYWAQNHATEIDIPYDAATGKYVKTDLAPGYYMVMSNSGQNIIVETISGTVEVTNKNGYPTITKKVNGATTATVDEGNPVTFTLEVTIPETNSVTAGYIVVHDTNEGVNINSDSIEITSNERTNDQIASLINGEYIEVITSPTDGCEMEVKIEYRLTGNPGEVFTITYTGTVNALDKDATNTAWVTLESMQGETYYTSTDSTVTISNAKFSIFKHDGVPADGTTPTQVTPIQGAGFVVAKDVTVDGNTSTVYYKWYEAQTSSEISHVEWVANMADATEVFSDENGSVVFNGLAEGTYKAIEKTVPAGYNKAEDPTFEIAVGNDGIAVDIGIDVINKKGTVLPSTGGIGTTLFYVIGGLMMTGAAVLLITKKRMSV